MHSRYSLVQAALLVVALLSLVPAGSAGAQEPVEQMRAVWVDAINPGFHNPAEVDELVSNAVRANMNTLIVQVRRHGDAWYNQSIEPRAALPELAPAAVFDPLATVLEKAHAAGLKVHAWLVISVACRDSDRLRGHPQHVCTAHGPSSRDPERWTTATHRGAQVGDLDYGHPSAVHYLEQIVQSLARSYPALDGIHYDYIRYADAGYGYNATSLARFRAAYALPANYWPAPDDLAWSQWRRDRVTELVRRLYIRVKAINPRLQVSAATITWGGTGSYGPDDWQRSAAYARVFQDWRGWLAEGIIDFAVPMHYFAEADNRARGWYDGWLAWDRAHPGRRAIVAGTGGYINNPSEGIEQVRRALAPDGAGRRLAGVALFSYNVPISNSTPQWRREYMDLLRGSVFAGPARAPDWPWIARPTTGHLQGMAAIDGQLVPDAHITLLRDGAWAREFTASVDGWYGAVDLEPGVYSVIIRRPSDGRTARVDNLPVAAGAVMSGP